MTSRSLRDGLILGSILMVAALAPAAPDRAPRLKELARARLEVARTMYEDVELELKEPGPGDQRQMIERMSSIMERLATWSRRWMEAERDAGDAKAAKVAAIASHVKRLKKWEDDLRPVEQVWGRKLLNTLKFYRLEAESWLAEAESE